MTDQTRTPADEGIEAARQDARDAVEMRQISDQLQTWTLPMLLKMEGYTHSEGQTEIRHELAARGIGRTSKWVGFYEAFEEWFSTKGGA